MRIWLSLVAALLGCAPAYAADQTLRVIAHADLKVLDTTANTTYITNRYGYLVYDTLFGLDSKFAPQPQMVERWTVSDDRLTWTFALRPGLLFHDGAPVTAADCIASLKRWMARDAMGQQLNARIAAFEATNATTFKLVLTEPYALVLETFGRWGVPPFIMPEKVASAPVNEPITSSIGSGPFIMKRDEWRPGSKVVYTRNKAYAPRAEPPDYMAGGKVAKLERVEWHYIPDANTALSALLTGEMDYYELPPLDFVSLLKDNPDIVTRVIDKLGVQQFIRPNSLHPPFDNFKARQALLYLASQEEFNQAVVGNPELYLKFCGALFMCGSDNETDAGSVKAPDLGKAKALLAEGGYKGEKLIVLQPTDRPPYNAATMVMVDKLRAIGVNVDLQPSDWSTISIRRARRDPPDKGGWHIVITGHGGPDASNPISNYWIGANCEKANIGWPCDPKLQAMIADWSHEPDRAKRRTLIPALQEQALTSVSYAPMGQFFQPIAYRKNVTGVLEAGMPVYWNIEKK